MGQGYKSKHLEYIRSIIQYYGIAGRKNHLVYYDTLDQSYI